MTPHQPPIPTPDEIVEAMARGHYDANKLMTELGWDDLAEMAKSSPSTRRLLDEKRAAMRAALRALPPGVVLVAGVPDERPYLDGDGEYVDAANAGAAGHNACRAEFLRRVVEVGE